MVSKYVVLDPSVVPDDSTEDLTLYIECMLYEAAGDREYDEYYEDLDMTALSERYSNVGTVLVDCHGNWAFFDTVTGEIERVEMFPDYSEIKSAFYELSNEALQQHFDKTVGE